MLCGRTRLQLTIFLPLYPSYKCSNIPGKFTGRFEATLSARRSQGIGQSFILNRWLTPWFPKCVVWRASLWRGWGSRETGAFLSGTLESIFPFRKCCQTNRTECGWPHRSSWDLRDLKLNWTSTASLCLPFLFCVVLRPHFKVLFLKMNFNFLEKFSSPYM